MSFKPVKSSIQGRTVDILNIIRNNASAEYQSEIPVISDVSDIPAVGQSICGNPTRSNEFINALVNRIALVVAESAIFRNPYEVLKKGYLEFGESVEEIFIEMAKVEEYSAEKAIDREFKRTPPDVKSVFHIMNWKVMYPVTIQREELKRAFLSASGVEELITRIVDSLYTAAAYDEFLLVKYLLIKGVANGHIKPFFVDTSDLRNAGIAFRGVSNMMTFPKKDYNFAGVKNNAPKEMQYIIMDSTFNAAYDVDVLAAAFNMDRATFEGKLLLIDDFTTFDNERWATIVANSDMVEEVTAEELQIAGEVCAILADERYFQIYDEVSEMTDQKSGAGLYWNFFYHNWKIVGVSPFNNAVAFVMNADIMYPDEMTFILTSAIKGDESGILLFEQSPDAALSDQRYRFVQTEELTENGIAVNEYGAITIPADKFNTNIVLVVEVPTGTAGETHLLTFGTVKFNDMLPDIGEPFVFAYND